ncbi:MAG: GNAT family N-acetyltransferase [Alphaproteobacteria bacterium]|jgi:GNAT superfamily N-acetyltransferase|nr:GNAT family N-acetyltransferase [Alphaproteobacteria bacterium]
MAREKEPPAFSLRPGQPADDAACGRIIQTATLAAPTAERLPHARHLFEDGSPLAPEGYARIVTVDAADAVLGFADYDSDHAHLHYLFTAPEHQGLGVGGALVDAVQGAVAAPLTLTCFAVNDAALAWYLGHGFRITGGGFRELEGQDVVMIYLERGGPGGPAKGG